MTKELGPGEAATRKRRINQALYIAFAGVLGGVIGFTTGFFDQGDGSLFNGDWEQLKLAPGIAIALAIGLGAAFLVLPLYGFRKIDELKREINYISFTGGCLAVLAGFPIWAALYAGGFTPAPPAFGVYMIGFVSMAVSYLYAHFRS